jgi:class 3 adenylate cyclase
MKRSHWYLLILAGCFLAPAILCQNVVPLISLSSWEMIAEDLYSYLLRHASPTLQEPSRVVLLEVDQRTLDTYGWPIDRKYYIESLRVLKKSGHPWVLSLLQFQELGKHRVGSNLKDGDHPTSPSQMSANDKALAEEIRAYDRYVGSGLDVSQGSVLDAQQEDEFLPRVLLSSREKGLLEIPELPLKLVEADQFVRAEKAFGFGTRFGTEPIIHCMQSYITDGNHRGDFLLLSSLVWTAALASQSSIETATGAHWPRSSDQVTVPFERKMNVSYKTCDPYPGILTQDYLAARSIERISLAELLEDRTKREYQNKIVILASAEMRRFRGPGIETGQKNAVVQEQLLSARFLDGLMSGASIKRDPLKKEIFLSWLPILMGISLLGLSFVLSLGGTVTSTIALLGGLLLVTQRHLANQDFFIPIQALVSLSGSLFLQVLLGSYLKYYGIKRQVKFTEKLNSTLSQCNHLSELESLARSLCQSEFENASLVFFDYDISLYTASNDPEKALEIIDQRRTKQGEADSNSIVSSVKTAMRTKAKIGGIVRSPFRSLILSAQLDVHSKGGRLGSARISIEYEMFEEPFVTEMVEILRLQLGQHWHRIKLLVDQKLLDYQVLAEQSRGKIMGRFLTKMLVAKFSDSRTMEENLKAVLTPRATRAALLQADIRGYSKVAAQMSPQEMVTLLQGYFRQVVDAAQVVAQVKLIGDCIFLFIEDEVETPDASPADLALEIAKILVDVTETKNSSLAQSQSIVMTFGIAIHYGEVVVGNLSSDHCIDYTVIGTNVNLVARLEEMTKHPAVSSVIGPNGVILSHEACKALRRHKMIKPVSMDLKAMNVSVRSFQDVKAVYGMTATSVRSMTNLVLPPTSESYQKAPAIRLPTQLRKVI